MTIIVKTTTIISTERSTTRPRVTSESLSEVRHVVQPMAQPATLHSNRNLRWLAIMPEPRLSVVPEASSTLQSIRSVSQPTVQSSKTPADQPRPLLTAPSSPPPSPPKYAQARVLRMLKSHHSTLKAYLSSHPTLHPQVDLTASTAKSTRARDKLRHLLLGQFYDLSTDISQELQRRETSKLYRQEPISRPRPPPPPPTAQPLPSQTSKQEQANAKKLWAKRYLSDLSSERFGVLIEDILFELERRLSESAA